MTPAKQFDLCPWGKLNALPHMGWQHAGWLASYVVNAKNILEWGCGGSTLWMAQMNRTAQILSVEHILQWKERIEDAIGELEKSLVEFNGNARILYAPDSEGYAYPFRVVTVAPFDLIFVDGQERPACLSASYDLLAPGGVVFLHDSQRAEYVDAKRMLLEREGMKQLYHIEAARLSHGFWKDEDAQWAMSHPGETRNVCDDWKDESWVNPIAGMWAAQKS